MNLKETAIHLINKGVDAVDPYSILKKSLSVKNGLLEVKGKRFDLGDFEEVYVAGIGKASGPMAVAVEETIETADGCIIMEEGSKVDLKRIKTCFGTHPTPKRANVEGARKLIELADGADKGNLFIFLISGGGSALFCAPEDDISLTDLRRINKLLLESGANIHEINSVRKHLSKVKGGRFAQRVMPAKLISLILSDVVGDDLDVIASGPTAPDKSTYSDAVAVLRKYEIWEKTPRSVKEHLSEGQEGRKRETLKEDLPQVHNFIIASNLTALEAVKGAALDDGYNSLILSSKIEGEAREVGFSHAQIAKEIQDSGNPIEPPAVIVSGGETTVTIEVGGGKGGPNREFVLGAAIGIKGRENIAVAAVDTDGIDGVGKSGAFADGFTISRAGEDPERYLKQHDTQAYFDKLGDSIDLGQTGTNVNDLRVLIVE